MPVLTRSPRAVRAPSAARAARNGSPAGSRDGSSNGTAVAAAPAANKATAIRVHAHAVPARQDAVLRELLAPEFRNHDALHGCEGGLQAFLAEVRWFDDAFSDQQVRVLHAVAEGDLVALHVELTARHTGFFCGIAPSGRRFTVREMHMVRFAAGREAEHWAVRDEAALHRTLRGLATA